MLTTYWLFKILVSALRVCIISNLLTFNSAKVAWDFCELEDQFSQVSKASCENVPVPWMYSAYRNMSASGDSEDFELLYSGKANGVIPVYKYRSKATGFRVVLAQVGGPVVNGYFTLGEKYRVVLGFGLSLKMACHVLIP